MCVRSDTRGEYQMRRTRRGAEIGSSTHCLCMSMPGIAHCDLSISRPTRMKDLTKDREPLYVVEPWVEGNGPCSCVSSQSDPETRSISRMADYRRGSVPLAVFCGALSGCFGTNWQLEALGNQRLKRFLSTQLHVFSRRSAPSASESRGRAANDEADVIKWTVLPGLATNIGRSERGLRDGSG